MSKSIWRTPVDIELIGQMGMNTMMESLGIKFLEYGDDYMMATMPVDHRTHQPMGILHGGASVALAETLGSVASLFCLSDISKKAVVGIEINANHLKAKKSGIVSGKVTPIRIGRNIHVWNIDIRDENGDLVCISRLTTMVKDL